jgi:hypothetical protein
MGWCCSRERLGRVGKVAPRLFGPELIAAARLLGQVHHQSDFRIKLGS